MDYNNYGAVITEQGDLGLGVTSINESTKIHDKSNASEVESNNNSKSTKNDKKH